MTKKHVNKILQDMEKKTKYFDASKYSGKMNLHKDPLIIQKKLRDEWNFWQI